MEKSLNAPCLDFAHYRSIHHTDRHILFFALLHEHTSLY